VQPSLYDGGASYDACAGCTGTFGWNPVLGGDRYGHGSPVLGQNLALTSLYTRATPLQWYPDHFGGGPGTGIPSDATFEQTVNVVSGAPLAFKVHFKLTHDGTDYHYNAGQEFPAVYVNSIYTTLAYYSGMSPWTGGALTKTPAPPSSAAIDNYASEQWAALVDSNNQGLAVFVPAHTRPGPQRPSRAAAATVQWAMRPCTCVHLRNLRLRPVPSWKATCSLSGRRGLRTRRHLRSSQVGAVRG